MRAPLSMGEKLALVIAAVAAVGGGVALAFQPAKVTHILIVGDSEAGAEHGVMPFIGKVKRSNEDVQFDYKNGTRIQFWAKNIPAALARHPKPDVVIVFLGTNNYTDTVLPDLSPILNVIQATGAKCIWVGPTSVHGKTWTLDTLLANGVSPCVYVDTEALGIELVDGIHPTADAAVKWLEAIWAAKDRMIA